MARIGVVYSSLSHSLGGAEKLCIETIHALKCAGHQIDLIVTAKTDQKKIKEIFGVCVDFDKEIIVHPHAPLSTIYSRFIKWFFRDVLMVSHLRKNYDLMVTTQPFLPLTFTDVVYMNDLLDFPTTLELHYSKYRRGFWKFYKLPYETIIDISIKLFNSLKSKPLVLTNSRFTKQKIEGYLNVKPLVVYPPVDVANYLRLSRNTNRENIVLTISRLEKGKGLELIPYVASRVKSAKFVIVGSLSSRNNLSYLHSLICNLGVKDRVEVVPNASHRTKEILLSKAKIYLHPRKNEYFGIAVVEAMAAGSIPLVHRSGGPWIDILNQEQGVYGYSYEDIVSCANHINEIIEQYSRLGIPQRAVERSKIFTTKIFRKNINSVVNMLLRDYAENNEMQLS
ncbi:MAG: glycosyltransferase [Candidatus Jordarchaeaceae archaeon]